MAFDGYITYHKSALLTTGVTVFEFTDSKGVDEKLRQNDDV